MTRAEVLDVIYRFTPRGLSPDERAYLGTPESLRRREAIAKGIAEVAHWEALLARLRERLGVFAVHDDTPSLLEEACTTAYAGAVWLPAPGPEPRGGHALAFFVSWLGPYYGICGIGDPSEASAAPDIAAAIEAFYPGYAPVPAEIGDERVPEVDLGTGYLGGATVYECLFSTRWRGSSGTYRIHEAQELPQLGTGKDPWAHQGEKKG